MLTYENRCPICGENRLENVRIKEKVAHCQICSCRYRLEEELSPENWEELMRTRESA